MRAKAIVIERAKNLDVSKADAFGEITYVFPMGAVRSSIWSEDFVDETMVVLSDMEYDPVTDYIVLVGAQVTLMKIIGRLCAEYGRIRILCWNSVERDYVLQEVGHARNSKASVRSS